MAEGALVTRRAAPEPFENGIRPGYLGGTWIDAPTNGYLDVVDPVTEEVMGRVANCGRDELDAAMAVIAEGQAEWAARAPQARIDALTAVRDRLAGSTGEIADLDVREAGLTIGSMRKDAQAGLRDVTFMAGLAHEAKGETLPSAPSELSYTITQPYGVVGRIVPYNHPFRFALQKCAAPLVAGNAVVLKPAEQTSGSALLLARATEGILPPGVFNVITGDGASAGEALAGHPRIPRIAFTGGYRVARQILERAAVDIKHVTLELGGKNPLVVYPDAPVDGAVARALASTNLRGAAGQSCTAASILLVHRSLYGPFLEKFAEAVEALRVGDPSAPATEVGPLVTRAHHDRVVGLVERARSTATLVTGGARPAHLERGFYLAPTVFTDVPIDSELAQTEVFGPVVVVNAWDTEADLRRALAALPDALTAGILTNDLLASHRAPGYLNAGMVYVNRGDGKPLGLPFGGYGKSGQGKENCLQEIQSYLRWKSVSYDVAGAGQMWPDAL